MIRCPAGRGRSLAAIEALILAAEGRGPLLHARVGMLRAMNHGRERVFAPIAKRRIGASGS